MSTANYSLTYAKGAGSLVSRTKLNTSAKILDTTENYQASEALRKLVSENEIAALTLNIEHDHWHNGWLDGSILRVHNTNTQLSLKLEGYVDVFVKKRIFYRQSGDNSRSQFNQRLH